MQKVLLIVLFSALTFSLQAQLHKDFGIKAGINVANLKAENTSALDPRLALHLGVLAHLHFSTHWAVQPEIVVSGQGAEQTISGVEYKVKLGYINVPVLFQYMTGTGFRFATGPQLGVMVSAKTKADDGEAVNVKKEFNTFDVAWALGASYVTDRGFGVDARYNIGLMDAADGSGTLKNRVWQFGLFYQFNVTRMGEKHIK